MPAPTIQVTWRLPPALWDALKAEAQRRDMTMQALAIEKLEAPSSAGVGTHGTEVKS